MAALERISRETILGWDRKYRKVFMNAVSGYKTAAVVGTVNASGQSNLAVFNQLVHIGANPPFIALVMRPTTVPRHTYNNIRDTGHWTINHVHPDFLEAAHKTAGPFPEEVSEFQACGLTEQYSEGFPAPFVAESRLRMGLAYEEEYTVKASGVILLVGKVLEVQAPAGAAAPDGFLDLSALGLVATGGLDAYYEGALIWRPV